MTDPAVRAADSFGARAREYDRLRPGYPAEALTTAVAAQGGARPGPALDIGCGTGKLAGALRGLGYDVLGVEPDPRMAAVATANGVAVEVAAFEDWDDAGRRFGTVACGQAWHWLRPGYRSRRAARLLRPGGNLLLAWNFGTLNPLIARGLHRVYAGLLPDGLPAGQDGLADLDESDAANYARELREHGLRNVTTTVLPWYEVLTGQQWCDLLSTESRHLALPEGTRRRLLREVGRFLDRNGGRIRVDYRCTLVSATAEG
ncbi:class I SAM-dependent methyltransferase [Actinoplanes teichomyceticus]|uniref:Methyltransferase family protein n=1 Tax=Actinoplanes teichomyceticus TaxID=1867 RepID=A0A561VLP0_ACTTI|nr:class I SAM-dependent methyltransferase [Actinoplanes teichomyceticus]TWG12531.1 methyltransferase family protein [Actinoplanes teichomyceticus]GIF13896.1 methyltransferase type 11 [Actinoplanes teichomyceticus]